MNFTQALSIYRNDFFSSFYDLLDCHEDVEELRAIEQAFVPVIKFKFKGVEIDLTFTRLCVDQVPLLDEDLQNFELFNQNNLDLRCLRSLNGFRLFIPVNYLFIFLSWFSFKQVKVEKLLFRSCCLILQFVPDVEKFKLTLRAVKLWAQSQGIYGNILGYLGGFSWAVLVARVCIDHPELDEPNLLKVIFHVCITCPISSIHLLLGIFRCF